MLIIIIIIHFLVNLYIYYQKKKNPSYEPNKNNISNSKFKFDNNIYNNDYSEDKIEEIDTNILSPIQNKLMHFIELSPEDQRFLNGIIWKFRPNKIVEIGVSAGGTAALILNAIKSLPSSKLYSIDRNTYYYKNKVKKNWMVSTRKIQRINE